MGFLIDVYGAIPAEVLPDNQVANLVRARNMLINHLNRMFIELQILAERKEETAQEKEERMKKDSLK
jgi:aminopeptidase C